MSESILTDLDELVMQVRDRTSRAYLQEAVAAYRGRAYRSAVVATWLAVVFDMISKIRELANQGDAAAQSHIERIDNAIRSHNVQSMQKIEGDLLSIAKDKFEILSEREFRDFVRLRDDRNYSAHPAFVQPGAMFVPAPDLVRSHIVHAASHLLIHPAVQGRSALARIKADILQPSFPEDQERAIEYLISKYLNHARHSLLEALIAVLLKAIVFRADPELVGRERSMVHCLIALARVQPTLYDNVIREQLRRMADGATDDVLLGIFQILPTDPQCWSRLDHAVKLRMIEMVRVCARKAKVAWDTPAHAMTLMQCLAVPDLKHPLEELFEQVGTTVQAAIIADRPHRDLAEAVIRVFESAHSWRSAESRATSILLPMARCFDAEHVVRAVGAAKGNVQIWDASGVPRTLAQFFDAVPHHHQATRDAWMEFLTAMDSHGRGESYNILRDRMVAAGLIK